MAKEALELRNGSYFPIGAHEINPLQVHLKTFWFLKDNKGRQIENPKLLDIPEGIVWEEIDRRNWSLEAAQYMPTVWVFFKGMDLCRIKDKEKLGDKRYSYPRKAFFRTAERSASSALSTWRSSGAALREVVFGWPEPLKAAVAVFTEMLYQGRRMQSFRDRLRQEIEKTDLRSNEVDSFLVTMQNYALWHIGHSLKPDFEQELAVNLVKVINTTRQTG